VPTAFEVEFTLIFEIASGEPNHYGFHIWELSFRVAFLGPSWRHSFPLARDPTASGGNREWTAIPLLLPTERSSSEPMNPYEFHASSFTTFLKRPTTSDRL